LVRVRGERYFMVINKNIVKKSNIFIIIISALTAAALLIYLPRSPIFKPASKFTEKNQDMERIDRVAKRIDASIGSVRLKKSEIERRILEHAASDQTKTAMKNTAALTVPDMLLRGIASKVGGLIVFLNNEVLGIGDELDGYKVVTITKNSVTLKDRDGKDRVLYIEESKYQKP